MSDDIRQKIRDYYAREDVEQSSGAVAAFVALQNVLDLLDESPGWELTRVGIQAIRDAIGKAFE